MSNFVLGIDQGTSGSRALVLDAGGAVRGYGYQPLARMYPRPEWVEQDPGELAEGVWLAIGEALSMAGIRAQDLTAAGVACQRDTDFAWDAETGRALANAITWQDMRTRCYVEAVAGLPYAPDLARRLGHHPLPYGGALHMKWRLEHDAGIQAAARAGRLRFGASANWVVRALGRPNGHKTDAGLAQSLALLDFRAGGYWAEWVDWLGIPREALPVPGPTVDDFGVLDLDGVAVPVRALAGDQQAALFGYDCHQPGEAEATHGTNSFLNVNVGRIAPDIESIKTYIAWTLPGELPTYCLEADTTVTGAVVRWMRENLGLLERETDLGALAGSVADAAGVVFVPALTGLNVPYRVQAARGSIFGLALGHTKAHVARAFLDSIGFQMRAVIDEIEARTSIRIASLKVGGGLSSSDLTCQLQADWTGRPVIRPAFAETTARAAALLAGLGAGLWSGTSQLPRLPNDGAVFEPRLSADQREAGYAEWNRAIHTVLNWSGNAAIR
jgi:glycerol kinase